MRQLNLGQSIGTTPDAKLTWLEQAMREIERASYEDDSFSAVDLDVRDIRARSLFIDPALNTSTGVNNDALAAITTQQITNGTYTGSNLFGYAHNHLYVLGTAIDTSGATAKITNGLLVDVYVRANSKSNIIAGTFAVTVPAGTAIDTSDSTLLDFVGIQGYAKSSSSLGGTNLGAGAQGGIFGGNFVAINDTTNIVGLVGNEINVQSFVGSSQVRRLGLTVVLINPSETSGATYDTAFHVGANALVTAPWKNGLLFSIANGGNPISTTGKLIATMGAATVDMGVDISSYTCTTAAFKSIGFIVDGSGTTTITSTSASALAVGRLGATNPVFVVKASQPIVATGVRVVGDAAGNGAGIEAISSGTNELLAINAKGSGDLYLQNSTTGAVRIGNALLPKTDASASVGDTTNRWAGVHLSSGSAINWSNGNYTLTHSSGLLTFSGDILWGGAAWTSYTPTITAGAGTPTTVSATGRYKVFGKTVIVTIDVTVTTTGTAAGAIIATLPLNSAAFSYVGTAREHAIAGNSGAAIIAGGTDATKTQAAASTGVFWANGAVVAMTIAYELP
jgi:hypothetical protein